MEHHVNRSAVSGLFIVCLFLLLEIGFVSSSATITVPTAGNCGDDTVLTCHVTGNMDSNTGWFGLGRTLVINGVPATPEDSNKYTETKGTSSFTLTIHNTDLTDEGEYRCRNGLFDEGQLKRLNIECKASAADLSVTSGKKVSITVEKLFPSSPELSVSFRKENTDVTIPGSRTCSSSTQYGGYYRCIWSSSNSLADGSYTYSIVVTTITQADPLTGSFKIVSPNSPIIFNTTTLDDNRVVLYGNEGQPVTIQCISMGGFPSPTVAWYKDSVSDSNQLASTSTGALQNDDTYTVTLTHTFTPTASDDKKTLICRSFYPQADSAYRASKTTTVMLYLRLKPSRPTVTQVSDVSSGGTVEVRCTTTGSRPAATITWSYQGSTSTGQDSTTKNNSAETYTVTSVFGRQVTAADNGREVQCIVTHPVLVSPSERTASVKLNVQFSVQASTTVITGNKVFTATGTATLNLTCTTGSSNPVSDITWTNGSTPLNSNRPYTNTTGENNGVVRSQQLVLKPTRYMDGDVIMCSVSNLVSHAPVTDTATLDLKYSPLIKLHGLQQTTLTEGSSVVLSCTADSKPLATITWYHNDTQLLQGNPGNSVLNYSLTPVNRTHYGTYRCNANNRIIPEDERQIFITIKFKPLSTSITGNNNIIANGENTLSLDCMSGSSYPISDITWKVNGQITSSTTNLSDQSGEYGGMKRRSRLTLTPTRDNDGDSVTCEASNTIGTSRISESTLNLRYRSLINAMQDMVAVEGSKTELTCSASSKPASTFEWYRGQSGVIYRGNGTLDNNQLTYKIDRVNRTDAGTYRCNASNGIEMADEKSVTLIVHYPPVVSVVTTNTSVTAISASLTCSASGVPNTSYVYGKWIQTWPGQSVTLKEYPGNMKLELEQLTYEHSGVYKCSASNGIKVFGTDKEYIEGSAQLVVKSYPLIVNVPEIVSARLNENVTMHMDYFSNAAGSRVSISKNVNGSGENNIIFTVSETTTEVNLPVFQYSIKTSGTRAFITMKIESKEDFGPYDVVVSNEINSTFRTIEIIPKGPPGKPSNLSVDENMYKAVSLSWLRGYHGGFPQTFVVEVSTDLKKWKNVSSVYDGKIETAQPVSITLTGLQDSTTYFLHVYAYNDEGVSPYTDNVNFTTMDGAYVENQTAISVAGAFGGALSGLIIIALVIIIVVMYRRNSCTKENLRNIARKITRKKTTTDENKIEMSSQDNPVGVYEKLQRVEERGNKDVYDSLEDATDNRNAYENLNKEAVSSSAYATVHTGAPRDESLATYENLKLNR